MMNTKSIKYLFGFVLALWASALSAQAHWSFDYHQYQYDMTVYFVLQQNGQTVTNLDNYEVAAFVNDECRGVATFETQTGSNGTVLTYGFMKVYSNSASGDNVRFKYYDNEAGEEKYIAGASMTFNSSAVVGYPSSPETFEIGTQVMMGDVDGDGRITINDAVLTISATFGSDPSGFNRNAADMDGDGRITINDAVLIINQTF